MKDMEVKIARLERIVSKQALELQVAEEIIKGKVVGPKAKRRALSAARKA